MNFWDKFERNNLSIALVVLHANVDVRLFKDSNGEYVFINKTIEIAYLSKHFSEAENKSVLSLIPEDI